MSVNQLNILGVVLYISGIPIYIRTDTLYYRLIFDKNIILLLI